MLLSEAFEAYREIIVYRNQSAKTEENHLVCLRALLNYFGDIEIESLSFDMIKNWKLSLDKKVSQNTSRCYVIKLRVLLGYLLDQGINCIDPKKIPVPRRYNKVPRFLTEDQVTTLIESSTKKRNKAIVSLLYASGIRVSELCQLNKGDVRNGTFTIVGKGNKPRICFIDERTQVLLTSYLNSRKDNYSHLFYGKFTCHRITPGNVQEIFRHLRNKTCIEASPHTMRHSFATNLLRNNMNIRYVQSLLGHNSLDTVAIYTHVVDTDLQREYQLKHSI
jgi:site-specific recombinase XerD